MYRSMSFYVYISFRMARGESFCKRVLGCHSGRASKRSPSAVRSGEAWAQKRCQWRRGFDTTSSVPSVPSARMRASNWTSVALKAARDGLERPTDL